MLTVFPALLSPHLKEDEETRTQRRARNGRLNSIAGAMNAGFVEGATVMLASHLKQPAMEQLCGTVLRVAPFQTHTVRVWVRWENAKSNFDILSPSVLRVESCSSNKKQKKKAIIIHATSLVTSARTFASVASAGSTGSNKGDNCVFDDDHARPIYHKGTPTSTDKNSSSSPFSSSSSSVVSVVHVLSTNAEPPHSTTTRACDDVVDVFAPDTSSGIPANMSDTGRDSGDGGAGAIINFGDDLPTTSTTSTVTTADTADTTLINNEEDIDTASSGTMTYIPTAALTSAIPHTSAHDSKAELQQPSLPSTSVIASSYADFRTIASTCDHGDAATTSAIDQFEPETDFVVISSPLSLPFTVVLAAAQCLQHVELFTKEVRFHQHTRTCIVHNLFFFFYYCFWQLHVCKYVWDCVWFVIDT